MNFFSVSEKGVEYTENWEEGKPPTKVFTTRLEFRKYKFSAETKKQDFAWSSTMDCPEEWTNDPEIIALAGMIRGPDMITQFTQSRR